MYNFKRHFTLQEARNYLSRLKYEIGELISIKHHLDEIGFNIHTRKYRPGFNPDTLTEFPDPYVQFMDHIRHFEKEGIIIKGIEEGLADFPALRENGEEVFLCWKYGEEDIKYWHSLQGGFRGRQPLDTF